MVVWPTIRKMAMNNISKIFSCKCSSKRLVKVAATKSSLQVSIFDISAPELLDAKHKFFSRFFNLKKAVNSIRSD